MSRVFYWALGVEFDDSMIDAGWQTLDRNLLQDRLLETLFYSHSQPPLLNLLVGIVLKLSHLHATLLFGLVFLGFGLLLIISMYKTMMLLEVSPTIAAAACVVFIVSPSTVLYENWLMTTYPVASLLMATFWFFARFTQRGGFVDGLLFAVAISGVALIRPTYHLVWVVGLILLAWWVSPTQHGWTRIPLILACLLVAAVYMKNYAIFGTFSSSSWLGMNLYSPISRYFPEASRIALLDSGRLYMRSRGGFVPLDIHGGYSREARFEAIPCLANERKSSGVLNFNHYGYLEIARKYMHDDLVMLQECPRCYLRSIGEMMQIYLRSSSAYAYFNSRNMSATEKIRWVYDNVLYGRGLARILFGWSYWGKNTYPFLLVGIPAVIITSVLILVRAYRRGHVWVPLLGGIVGTCIVISSVYCLLETDDSNRYRYELDPFLVTLGAFVASQWYMGFRNRMLKGPVMVEVKASEQ